MTAGSDLVTSDVRDATAVLTLGAPPVNALSIAMISAIDAALDRAHVAGARVVVVRSSLAQMFVAGADLNVLAEADRDGFAAYLELLRGVVERIAAMPALSIAVLDGPALGGGLELALACTLRVASPRARVGVPEVKLGLLPGAGGTVRLPARIGPARALDLLLTGRAVGGEEALAMGLVDRLDDDPEAGALALADRLAAVPPPTVAAIRRCVAAAAMDVELRELLDLFTAPGGRDGITAFLARQR